MQEFITGAPGFLNNPLHLLLAFPATARRSMRILIAEDDRHVRRLIRELMETLCDDIIECSDGLEAYAICRRMPPDLVLMDISMPRMNGIEATRRIRALSHDIPVVIITQHDDAMYRTEANRVGALAYFLKDDLTGLQQFLRTMHGGMARN